MLHDQGEHQRAADTLQDTIGLIDRKKLKDSDEERARLVGRMNYFRSCQLAEQGDREKQREHLDRALEADPAELDALIARYRLPGVNAEYDRQTLELIERAADGLARQIQTSPDEPQNYNQFAWLVGNTTGDSDEALRRAKLAVEMAPASGAYYDTLAHVYFGRGELEAAVKNQIQAARLDPHSGLIAKQLAFFRQKLQEKQAAGAEPEPTPPAAPEDKESSDP
jgi:tetratricopeptide (TPR) repeat protein